MTTDKGMRSILFFALLGTVASGCATTNVKDDPLQNTRKLVVEGHASLYNNGAFRVPNTSISLIPPGPSTLEFVSELAGMRARQSFETSVKNASESVYIVSEGTKITYNLSKNISSGSAIGADAIKNFTRENSTLLVYRSSDLGKTIIGKSWEFSKTTFHAGEKTANAVIQGTQAFGTLISEKGKEQGTGLAAGSRQVARDISGASASRSGSALTYAGNAFVKGYVAVPSKMKKRAGEIGESLNDARFGAIAATENERRKLWSQKTIDLMTDTAGNYTANVSDSFGNAGKELNDSRTTGMSLAVLKSMRWVLQGILWDATIEPLTKMTAASVGYIGVNFLAFPSMVVVREGVATTKVAVEVTWDAAKMGYDLIAPTAVAAVAGVYGVLDFTASHAVAGSTAAVGNVLGYSEAGLSPVAGVLVKGSGFAAGKGVQYVGIPLASAGIALGGGTVGTAVGGVGTVAGGALFVGGEAGSATTQVFGNIIAGATLVGGTSASAAGGAAYGVYELSKAVVVPAGYEVGSGIVLSYGTLSHLGAHSILAVADCSYMVLSLEGPRWVLYAVKGKLGNGEDLPAGTVVDLRSMQGMGEDIYYLPVSDEVMKDVVQSLYDDLPEIKSGD